MAQPEPSLLLLVPAYNEEKRIEPVLRDYAQYFRTHYTGKFQMVVVLNGCRDNTLGVVQRVARLLDANIRMAQRSFDGAAYARRRPQL